MDDPGTITESTCRDKEAERYKREYAEFIEIAAHDLDAPLRKLGVLVEKATADHTGSGEYVHRINRCLGDMRSLVDNLAMLSRLALGSNSHTVFGLEGVIAEALQDIQQMAKDKKTSVTIGVLPVVKGDRAQYRQLFKNLLQNAIIFSKKSISPVIDILPVVLTKKEREQRLPADEKEYFAISITDNGIGFRQEDAEKIFRPFIRLHGKSEYEGNGIGLALCKKIIENHHGIIYADSDENTGSRFVLIIPQTTD